MPSSVKADKAEQLKWRAEDIVRDAMKNTPAYKAAIKQAVRDLKAAEKSAARNFKRSRR